MFGIHLIFAAPEWLSFLLALPLLWWLLRLTPPAPKKIVFPALTFLRDLTVQEETPARTPWWLLVLRLVIVTFLITAFARPLIDPISAHGGAGALLIAIDNDWAAARDWDMRQKVVHDLIHEAAREGRSVILLPTTPPANGETLTTLGPLAPEAAFSEAARLKPEAWPSDWQQAKTVLQKLDPTTIDHSVWITSGLGNMDAKFFYAALQKTDVRVIGDTSPIYMLAPPITQDDQLMLPVLRAETDDEATLSIAAVARDGNALMQFPAHFTPGAPRVLVPLALPLDIRNQIARFDVEGQRTAGATALLDASWEHRPVGLVGDQGELAQHSLLSALYYVDRALKPYADLHVDPLSTLLKQKMAVLILTDNAEVDDGDIPALLDWIKEGGILVRFAGEKLAAAPDDAREAALLPVTLRIGDRSLGGALSWATPQKLRAFPAESPFRGLSLPDDVTISRQILAEPDSDLASKTWAALEDGTPLVTAKTMGQGSSILFHVPARSDWSNLPLSGLFVDMLRRIVDLSRGVSTEGMDFSMLRPLRLLNGFGDEQSPGPVAQPLGDTDLSHITVGPQHPPGLYGSDAMNRAFNLGVSVGQPEALIDVPVEHYTADQSEKDLEPDFLIAAFFLLLLDFWVSLRLRGLGAWKKATV